MGLTTDRNDPDLGRGPGGTGMNKKYLVLSDEELAQGFIRPVRLSYVHEFMLDGSDVPVPLVSREGVGGCGAVTSMNQTIAETYARKPDFYGATYCVGCHTHLPVGLDGQFYWDGTTEKVGT